MRKKTRKNLEAIAKLLAGIAGTLIGLAELIKVLKQQGGGESPCCYQTVCLIS